MTHNSEIERLLSDPEVRKQLAALLRHPARGSSLPDSAIDDINQIVLMKLLRLSKERLENIKDLKSYVVQMALNEAIKYRFSAKTRSSEQLEDDQGSLLYSDKSEGVGRIESSLLLRDILESLTEGERQLLELMIIGYTEKEMARRLEITHDAARQRVSRLRKRIRELIFES